MTLLPTGSISYLYYVDRLYQISLAIIGIALGTAVLPDLWLRIGGGDEAGAAAQLSKTALVALVNGIPRAVVLALLGDWIMEILFARGAFSANAVDGSAAALAAYAVRLPAAISLRALVSAFHGRGDTITPVKILAVSTAVNLALKVVLIGPLVHAGFAAATTVGAWFYAGSLAVVLWRFAHLRPQLEEWMIGTVAAIGGGVMAVAIVELRGEGLSALGTFFSVSRFLAPITTLCIAIALGYSILVSLGYWRGKLVQRETRRL